jgi:hypothetical protein
MQNLSITAEFVDLRARHSDMTSVIDPSREINNMINYLWGMIEYLHINKSDNIVMVRAITQLMIARDSFSCDSLDDVRNYKDYVFKRWKSMRCGSSFETMHGSEHISENRGVDHGSKHRRADDRESSGRRKCARRSR